MTDPEFDDYSDSYRDEVQKSIDFIGRDHSFFTQIKADLLVELAREGVGDPARLRALDVGCGTGETDTLLVGRFGRIEGVDISEGLLETARRRNPGLGYRSYDGKRLPYEDGTFDLVFTICVVHHVPPRQWEAFVAELARVVRPGGALVVIEHNPLNPLTRLAVSRCEFDENAELLARRRTEALVRATGLRLHDSRYVVFFPWAHPIFRRLERALRHVPLGAQYVVTGYARQT